MAKEYTQEQLEAGAERLLNDLFPGREQKMARLRREEEACEMPKEQADACLAGILAKLNIK